MKKWLLIAFFITNFSLVASAKYDVVLIHGYSNYFDNASIGTQVFSKLYWAYWELNTFKNVRTKHLVWDSKRRVNDQMADLVAQYKGFLNEGHCAPNGCIIFTHSTGGLVVDMLMAQSYASKGGANDFSNIWKSTVATVPIASAGGGVNLAVYFGDFVAGGCSNFLVASAIQAVLPFVKCGDQASLGAGYDLQPNVARSINGSDNINVPALMVAGYGNMAGNIIKPFLYGTSDGLVAMHSACGGNKFDSYTSCVTNLGPDGLVDTHTASALYKNHYPYIMTGEGHGSELAPGLGNTDILNTFNQPETLVDNYGYSNIQTQTTTTGFWIFAKTYRNVANYSRHLSTIFYDNFTF